MSQTVELSEDMRQPRIRHLKAVTQVRAVVLVMHYYACQNLLTICFFFFRKKELFIYLFIYFNVFEYPVAVFRHTS